MNGQIQSYNDICMKFSPYSGSWQKYLTMGLMRNYHVSWTPENRSIHYLMGGGPTFGTMSSTTLIYPNGTQEIGFPLKYKTM